MTDTQNTQQTNQPAAPAVTAPAEATPAQEDKSLQEAVEKVVSHYNGFKDFLGGFSNKALWGIALASFLTLYFAPDCRGLRAPREISVNGARQPAGIAIDKNGTRSIIYCETPELLNELKIISQREGISLDKLVQKVDTERPYGKVSEKEVGNYLSKK